MDSIPCSVIYFWLIKSVRFFSLLCTVCQVHYLLTHKSSSVAKGKFPLCVQGLQLVHVTNPSTEELLHGGVAQHCRQRRTTEVVSLLSESERERAKLCSLGAVSHSFNLHLLLRGIIILRAAITDLLLPELPKQEESRCARPFWCCWKCPQ